MMQLCFVPCFICTLRMKSLCASAVAFSLVIFDLQQISYFVNNTMCCIRCYELLVRLFDNSSILHSFLQCLVSQPMLSDSLRI